MTTVECTPELLPADRLLIVLGKNIGVGSSPEDMRQRHDHLSPESRLNALAAGELWTPGTTILFSTGHTAGSAIPSEAAAMKAYFISRYPLIPEALLLLEEQSIDTHGNAKEVASMLAKQSYQYIGLITVGHHLPNATTLFRRRGVAITEGHASEAAVTTRGAAFERYASAWSQSDRVKHERQKEFLRRLILTVDRRGALMHQITARTRK